MRLLFGIIGEGAYQHCVFVRLSHRFGCLSVFSMMGIRFKVFRTCLFVFVHTIITMSLVATPGHLQCTIAAGRHLEISVWRRDM